MSHSPTAPPVMCPVPGAPSNGSVNASGQSYTEGSEVTYQCNDGLFPVGLFIITCTRDRDEQNGTWKPEAPSTVECRTVPGKIKVTYEFVYPYILYTVNCTVPEEPSDGTIVYVVDGATVNYERLNETVEETTVLTYQCDNGLSLTGPNTITCTNAGIWSTDPREIMCVQTITTTIEPGSEYTYCHVILFFSVTFN